MSADSRSTPYYLNPAAHRGEQVRVCGYVVYEFEKVGIYQTRTRAFEDGANLGVVLGSLQDKDLKRFTHRNACITGTIIHRQCGENVICTDSNAPYAVRADAIE